MRRRLEAGRTHVMDRWFAQFPLFNAIVAAGSDDVCRLRDNTQPAFLESRPVTPEAAAAGVLSDQVVRLGQSSPPWRRPDHPIRLVRIRDEPHTKRGGRPGLAAGPSSAGELLLATNLLDVPAEVVGLIYRYRWRIEIFFRFFKHMLGCGYLYWQHPRGIVLETYCSILACVLMHQATGRQPTRRTCEMLCYYVMGWADLDEVVAHVSRLQVQAGTVKNAK